MSSEENPKPVNVDPRCIQEALRMFLQPIKHDDPQLDFYTMYKRETMEYDVECMNKYNEDLNTTLIFAGLFSAVSSAFVIAVQPQLQPDPIERSEAYLRAILLSLNQSIAPGEGPAAPPAWNGPPAEIVTTSDLLYASLSMSMLAAFVAMLGKQWLNRYIRHSGGSMIERCGDRQRKFNGLERWPFRLIIESLPMVLQVALLLLACGLARYMWSINTSVARVIISFTALGNLFYIGIVIAGTSSYECPFQTPASTTLRYLRDSRTIRKLMTSLSPSNVISTIHTTWRNTRKLVVILSLPNATSLIYATWMDVHQGLILASHRAYDIVRHPLSWEISLPPIASDTHGMATRAGHQAILLLLRTDRVFGTTKHRLAQGIRRFRRAVLLPITVEDVDHQSLAHRNGTGLLVRVRNLESIRRQNAYNAHCVCWVLRNITDPEAIDSAIRLAGTIRWFDGDPNHDPPFDLIVSTLEACFDSTNKLYPGMRDRAYFSARAILQISMSARAQPHVRASKYPIPAIHSVRFKHTDPDLYHIIRILEYNFKAHRPTFSFPDGDSGTHTHLLWISNLLADVTHVGPNPILRSYHSFLKIAAANQRPIITNILVVWYMFLGGNVEEETLWAVNKSDSLEIILSHLSTRVTAAISDGNLLQHLYFLLEFLATWEKRPFYLTEMAYRWCSAISEAAGRLGEGGVPTIQPRLLGAQLSSGYNSWFRNTPQREPFGLRLRFWRRIPALDRFRVYPSLILDHEFSQVGPGCDMIRLDDTPHPTRGGPSEELSLDYAHLLFIALEIGFRQVDTSFVLENPLESDHTPHRDWMLKASFSSYDDEVIADAMCTLGAPGDRASLGLYLAKRAEQDTPFSPRLRKFSLHVIDYLPSSELEMSGLELVRLLDHLNVDIDDVMEKCSWINLLVNAICSPAGPEGLPSRYWRLLDRLVFADTSPRYVRYTDSGMKEAGLLEEAEDWERLETWLAVLWRARRSPQLTEVVEGMTLRLFSQQPSAIPRFGSLCEKISWEGQSAELRRVCDQAQTEQSSLGLPPPRSIPAQPRMNFSLPFVGDDTF